MKKSLTKYLHCVYYKVDMVLSRRKVFFLVLTTFICGALFGFLVTETLKSASSHTLATFIEQRENSGDSLINPLLQCDTYAGAFQSVELENVEAELQKTINQEIVSNRAENVSVYLRDLNNGPWIGINENELFAPASLLKLPIMMAFYKSAESQPDILDKKVTLTDDDKKNITLIKQNIVPAESVQEGQEYTIEDLVRRMIVYSDNGAWAILLRNLDRSTVESIFRELEIPLPYEDVPENFITVKKYASFFRILYNSSYLNREYSKKALRMLTGVDFKEGLRKGVPEDISVAHKFGERDTGEGLIQLHDCGIVYYPQHPYLLCVMTRGNDMKQLENFIAQVSQITYREIDKKYNLGKKK